MFFRKLVLLLFLVGTITNAGVSSADNEMKMSVTPTQSIGGTY